MSNSIFAGKMFTIISRDIISKPAPSNLARGRQPALFESLAVKRLARFALFRVPDYPCRLCFSTVRMTDLNFLPGLQTGVFFLTPQLTGLRTLQFQPMDSCHIPHSVHVSRRSSMKGSHRSFYLTRPTTSASSSFATKEDCTKPGSITQRQRLNFRTGPEGKPGNVSFSSTRCSEKACVFPATPQGRGKCSYHLHQQEEPVLFRSHQPTGMLLDPSRSMPSGKDDGSRKRDRRRMAEIWEQFQSDGAF